MNVFLFCLLPIKLISTGYIELPVPCGIPMDCGWPGSALWWCSSSRTSRKSSGCSWKDSTRTGRGRWRFGSSSQGQGSGRSNFVKFIFQRRWITISYLGINYEGAEKENVDDCESNESVVECWLHLGPQKDQDRTFTHSFVIVSFAILHLPFVKPFRCYNNNGLINSLIVVESLLRPH